MWVFFLLVATGIGVWLHVRERKRPLSWEEEVIARLQEEGHKPETIRWVIHRYGVEKGISLLQWQARLNRE